MSGRPGTRRSRPARVTAAVAAVVAVGLQLACLDDVMTTRPLTFNISTADSSVAVGDSLIFRYVLTGNSLARLSVSFGDSTGDLKTYGGFNEVNDFSVHAYDSAGTYLVRGEVLDSQGTIRDSLTVVVN